MLATEVSLEVNEIGENAGRVWDYVSTHEECTLSSLKKGLKLSSEDCCYALGWLARESKIDMRRKGTSLKIYSI